MDNNDCPIPDIPSEQEIRNKVIEEFAEKLKDKYGCCSYVDEISFEEIDKLAE